MVAENLRRLAELEMEAGAGVPSAPGVWEQVLSALQQCLRKLPRYPVLSSGLASFAEGQSDDRDARERG